jgi:hypothetical protein
MFVLNNDTDPELPSDTLTIVSVTPGAGSPNVSINTGNTSIHYTATAGLYYFDYTVQDSHGYTSTVTSSFEVTCRPGVVC